MIALLGSPFSPRYARARRSATGRADPLLFCAMNVAIHGPRGSLWALTERPVSTARISPEAVRIGESTMEWEGDRLVVELRERAPWTRQPIVGRIVFEPDLPCNGPIHLDPGGKHTWWPVGPRGNIDVHLKSPNVAFRARGYHDANWGDEPLEARFRRWTWSRAHARDRAIITYDVVLADGEERARAISIDRDGVTPVIGLAASQLPSSRWGIPRSARAAPGCPPELERNLEDTPFYCRDVVRTALGGEPLRAMHETLSVERLARRSIQFLLPFRMGQAGS